MAGRRRVEILSGVLGACCLAAGAAGCGDGSTEAESSRLEGRFRLIGKVTAAAGNTTIKKGGRAQGDWTFSPTCPSGACDTVRLRRRGFDPRGVLLRRTGDSYRGTGVDEQGGTLCRGARTATKARVTTTVTVEVTRATDGRAKAIAARTRSRGFVPAGRGCSAGNFSYEIRLTPRGS